MSLLKENDILLDVVRQANVSQLNSIMKKLRNSRSDGIDRGGIDEEFENHVRSIAPVRSVTNGQGVDPKLSRIFDAGTVQIAINDVNASKKLGSQLSYLLLKTAVDQLMRPGSPSFNGVSKKSTTWDFLLAEIVAKSLSNDPRLRLISKAE